MKQFLLTYFFFFVLAINSYSQLVKSKSITEQKSEITTTKFSDQHVITCILINNDSIYCYRGSDLQTGIYLSMTGENKYRAYIKKIKKTLGDSLVIVLKPTLTSPYNTTIRILDEMTLNGIKKYAMVKLSDKEKNYLTTNDFNWEPPEPIEIETPTSVANSRFIENIPYLLFTLTNKKTLYYELKTADTLAIKTEIIPFTENNIYRTLNKIESGFKISLKQFNILVYGNPDSRYPEFEKLINALRKKQLNKYNLVTTETL